MTTDRQTLSRLRAQRASVNKKIQQLAKIIVASPRLKVKMIGQMEELMAERVRLDMRIAYLEAEK